MGWDIVSVGNHKLDTSNIEILAKQLSEAFNINIEYGHINVIKYNEEKHLVEFPANYKFIKLGRITKSRRCKLYYLTDELYSEKIIYQKFNGRIENVVYEQNLNEDNEEYFKETVNSGFEKLNKNKTQYFLQMSDNARVNRKLYDLFHAYILNDLIDISIFEPFRWFDFVNCLKENPDIEIEEFIEYRQKMAELFKQVNASQAVYFADQGVSEMIMDKMWDISWNELIAYIKKQTHYDDYMKINFVDDFYKKMALKEYEERHTQLQISIPDFFLNGKKLYKQDDNIEVLFDDFKDLT